MKAQFRFLCILILILLLGIQNLFSATSTITGRVIDSENSQPLPGANVYLKDTNIGTATDIDGKYAILSVPPGTYTLVVNYIGFGTKEIDIQVPFNETVIQNIELDYTVLTGENVVITAQARGQTEAINQQIASRTVKNVVSSTKIQELPEANAAEAVGRLPGVSLSREGGEGTKVLIRGMAARYTKIQIDGVEVAATGKDDRSADLSMISPYMLEGIELTKSVMANQEATATGGIVNFKIRKASDDPSFNIIAQGGYNNLRDTYDDFKVSVGGSNRFFNKKFGVYAQADYEQKDAGSQQLGGISFTQENEDAPVRTHSINLMDIFRNVERLGGTMVLDYASPSTDIKLSNFYSRINREETQYQNNYEFSTQGFSIGFSDIPERSLEVLTNSLQIDHRWHNWEFNAGISHSYSENILPVKISSENANSPVDPFNPDRNANYNVNLDPKTIPDSLIMSVDDAVYFMNIDWYNHDESKTKERDIAGELNLAYNFNISDQMKVKLNFGGKVKHKTKEYDREYLKLGGHTFRQLIIEHFGDELSDRTLEDYRAEDNSMLLYDFLDWNFDRDNFFGGRYPFAPVFDKDFFRYMHNLMFPTYDPTANVTFWDMIQRDFVTSNYADYHGKEDYHAFYMMPEIDITSKFTFIPGVRYEANRTEYTGYRGNRLGVQYSHIQTAIDTVTKVRTNNFVLPMIQAVYRPTDWLNIKAGYTHTLQRPNYNNIMPGWVISRQGQIGNLSNFKLNPELSRNWDLQFSIYSNKIGLFTIGAFHKKITDMIFWTGQTVITDTAFFELPTIMHRQRAAYAKNNEYDAYNYGYEIEWQSNFWYLPGLLSGLVLNVNYTSNESKAEYLRSVIKTQVDPITYKTTLISEDTTYTNPMINQPDHLLNLTVGYDYKGFSIRGAMRYKSKIFTANSWYEKLRGYSVDFYRYDISVKQQLPLEGLEFFMNINNITDEIENNVINHNNYTTYLEDYGRSVNIGFRYRM